MPRFSIIIVSWNAIHHLKKFLPSVAETTYDDFEIILADNASTDGSKDWVRENYPQVKIVTFDENYGYCGGNNRAVPYATGDILLFLNNDVEVEPNWLQPLAECFNEAENIAVAQPKMRSYEEPDKFEYAGAAGGYIDRYGYPFCRGRIFDTVEHDKGQYDDPAPIIWASGAAFAVRKEVFQNAGGFDQDFEFHMEEIDLCWRIWNQGYTVRYCPGSIVYHLGGGSMPMGSPRKVYYNYRNSLDMLWKNYATSSLLTRFPMRLLFDAVASMRELFAGEWEAFKAIRRGHRHFWKSIGKTMKKRSRLQSERINKRDPDNIKPISIVWEFFVKGTRKYSDLPDGN